MGSTRQDPILHVGIIGCGEISQVAHIPNINFLAHRFRTTYLCDISQQSLRHCAQRVLGETPKSTASAEELCASPDVDVVLITNADAYPVEQGILALQNEKYCLIEKPASICLRYIDRLIEAEKISKGKVFVGTMRRFAAAFLDAVEDYRNQAHPQRFDDFSKQDSCDRANKEADIYEQAINDNVLFRYDNFPVVYESGLSDIPFFGAHIEVASPRKTVRVIFDNPYIKGLPVTLLIREKIGDGFQERKIRKTYEDPYTLELLDLYDFVVNGKTPKSGAEDAKKDLELFRMILQAGF
ncbi:hypothetical protein N7481_011246 [Penicillium waksmanii]|uniref:uncharacterized protein n=1 Tax=Penicillium waksmanii TaxID=69791 RepID=UPI002549006A|nr:uncharacterized protein N7481_011246 [Penicillium waksmanii]KAJ5974036.1 hypothetical protein N7481_011246 [Penicillium waksmanii]